MTLQLAGIPGAREWTAEMIAERCPFYAALPDAVKTDRAENARFRMALLTRAAVDPKFADVLWGACAKDVLFFINLFVWTLDPRINDGPRNLPMVTWEAQNITILEIVESCGRYDLWIEKSRDQGVSWMVLMVYLWFFLFKSHQHFGIGSKKALLVDNPGDPKALFSKLDHALSWLPEFLKGDLARTSMKLLNKDQDNSISGEETTAEMFRGGRLTDLFNDEASVIPELQEVIGSTSSVARGRKFVGTHKGMTTAFYANARKPGKRRLRVHWTSHPFQSQGLYTVENGKVKLIDTEYRGRVMVDSEEYDFPNAYPFDEMVSRMRAIGIEVEGKLFSPYYDNECARLGYSKKQIAEEMDIDPLGSSARYFEETIVLSTEKSCRPPLHVGDLAYDDRTGLPQMKAGIPQWNESLHGKLRLWVRLDYYRQIPKARYAVICDVSAGTGASNSTASIINLDTGEYVGSWCDPNTTPEVLARVMTSLRVWLGSEKEPALLSWEDNGGLGTSFGQQAMELLATNVAYDESAKRNGWWSGAEAKSNLFLNLRDGLRRGEYIIPDAALVNELREFVWGKNGPVHNGESTDDLSGARNAHGDRVIPAGIAWGLIRKYRSMAPAKREGFAPPGSLMAEIREQQRADRAALMDELPNEWEARAVA